MSDRKPKLTDNEKQEAQLRFTVNQMLLSRMALAGAFGMDPAKRDLDKECGYPDVNDPQVTLYRQYYDREGIARRVNDVFPDESWTVYPELYESDANEDTSFETRFNDLNDELNLWYYLHRADQLCGIGHYGGLLLGYSDLSANEDLSRPVKGVDPDTGSPKTGASGNQLLYMRACDESMLQVAEFDKRLSSSRYGQPTYYNVKMIDPNAGTFGSYSSTDSSMWKDAKVHWTRFFHMADMRQASEVFATPRMKPVLNRLFDVRKVLGGSAEMFWKGAFPGYSFETLPELLEAAEPDEKSLKKQIDDYFNGLKRYMALTGVTAKSLAPQVADPTNHITQQLTAICCSLGCPLPVFLGFQVGHLTGQMNTLDWNRRIGRRQTMYLNPMVIRPFTRRLVNAGALPRPKQIQISWRDLNSLTEQDKADVSLKKAQAILQFVTSGAEAVMPVKYFYTMILGMSTAEAAAVVRAAKRSKTRMTPDPNAPALPPANKPGAQNTNPQDRTGASGRRNGLGK